MGRVSQRGEERRRDRKQTAAESRRQV